MSNCFQLIQDGKAVRLQEVDDKMREHFGAPPDAERWYAEWYDTVGFALALGKDWTAIRATFAGCGLDPVIDWLETNYTVDAWVEVGRR